MEKQKISGFDSWKNLMIYIWNMFAVPLHLRSLFSPFKRDTDDKNFDLLGKVIFFFFSRILGFLTRVFCIALTLVSLLVGVLLLPIFLLIPIQILPEKLVRYPSFFAELSFGNTYTLNKYSHEMILSNNLNIYGKEKVMRGLERALSKDNKRNVILVGEEGVGKSTIIQYLGSLARSGFSHEGIRNHRVVNLEMESINNNDFVSCLDEGRSAGNIILVIDDIYKYEAFFDKILNHLEDNDLAFIVTTDLLHYDQVLKKHTAFLEKFEKIDVFPPAGSDLLDILENFAYGNGINIDEEVLKKLVNLTERYLGSVYEPSRTIRVLESLKSSKQKITLDDVNQIISDMANVPVGDMSSNEKQVLQNLRAKMQGKIVGQTEAVEEVVEALLRARAGVSEHTKPAGSFLFIGPTGVGKTYTAKVLAESYFGHKENMVRFDMSEFSQEDSLYTFGDRLGAVLEESPLSLVFLDELEKACRAIHNLLLQVLDEGMLTRSNGRKVNFRESIIIATSNAGSREILQNPKIDKKTLVDYLISERFFTPEFLNRFTGIVMFQPLNSADVSKVTRLMLVELQERMLKEKNVNFALTDDLVARVASAGFDPEFGARPIKRAIEQIVENKIAEYIVSGGDTSKVLEL